MVLNATFNNILAISWRSGLLVEETGILGKYQRPIQIHQMFMKYICLDQHELLILTGAPEPISFFIIGGGAYL
jgi:hypothetical protein